VTLPQWDEIQDQLGEIDAPNSPSEAHGMLCGLLCMGVAGARRTWSERALDGAAVEGALDVLYGETLRQLDDAVFEFELLLPDDEHADLDTRTAALAGWCTGFAFGIGASGRGEGELPADSSEFLHDVVRIAQAEAADEEDDEAAYAEVVEYVRMGVLLTRTECAASARDEGQLQ